jgi:hypothetical protein
MQASTKHSMSRRRGKGLFAALITLFALTASTQALAPAPAVARDDAGGGSSECVLTYLGEEVGWVGWNGEELCLVPQVSDSEPVIEVQGTAPQDDAPPPCPALGCLRKPTPVVGDRENFFGSRNEVKKLGPLTWRRAKKPKADQRTLTRGGPQCEKIQKVLQSDRYQRTMRRWRQLQDGGWDQTLPEELASDMNRVEWMQRWVIAWNEEKCGPLKQLVRLPTLQA